MKVNKFKKISGKNLKIAIVQARFNKKITDDLKKGALNALKEAGVRKKSIFIFEVPGSFEIPLVCQKIANPPAGGKKFDGIVTLGAVIKGETAHFEHVSRSAIDGIIRVMLGVNLPISLGVITTFNIKQARARSGDNKNNKGYEAAMALIEMINVLRYV